MSPSTPPAWHWLEDLYVPVEAPKPPVSATCGKQNGGETLSADSCNLSGADHSREQSDNPDPTGEDVWPLERVVSTTASSAVCADQCPECRCAPGQPHATGCEGTAHLADLAINAVPKHVETCVPEGSREHPTTAFYMGAALAGIDVGPEVTVESCPECGTVMDIDYGPESALLPKRESGAEEETFSVPFPVQEWTFESLCEVELVKLHDLIDDHHALISEMARERFRKGFAKYGSAAYQWDAETRLTNVLEELADSVVYLTTGAIE